MVSHPLKMCPWVGPLLRQVSCISLHLPILLIPWKFVEVFLLLKRGDLPGPTNCHSIYLASVVSEVFGTIISDKLRSFLECEEQLNVDSDKDAPLVINSLSSLTPGRSELITTGARVWSRLISPRCSIELDKIYWRNCLLSGSPQLSRVENVIFSQQGKLPSSESTGFYHSQFSWIIVSHTCRHLLFTNDYKSNTPNLVYSLPNEATIYCSLSYHLLPPCEDQRRSRLQCQLCIAKLQSPQHLQLHWFQSLKNFPSLDFICCISLVVHFTTQFLFHNPTAFLINFSSHAVSWWTKSNI